MEEFSFFTTMKTPSKSADNIHALILTVGYGEGHRAAAGAFAEHWRQRGYRASVCDPLAEAATARIYEWSCAYYRFCVRHAPLLWDITYRHTESTDLSRVVRGILFRPALRTLMARIEQEQPDLIICTYPLYGYLLDLLRERGASIAPYLMLVTDSIAMSRPWLRSKAQLWCVLDEYSRRIALDRYVLPSSRLCVAALPIAPRFAPFRGTSTEPFSILYAAQAPFHQVKDELKSLLAHSSRCRLTILAGAKYKCLRSWLHTLPEAESREVTLLEHSSEMDRLFREHQLYIGKAGAASVFEAYQSALPLIINFTIPGQEQGNLELIRLDGTGLYAEGGSALCAALDRLLSDDAKQLKAMRERMLLSSRRNGAEHLINFILNYLSNKTHA